MEIIVIFILVLLNGIFAMSEMSLVSSNKFKLESAKNKGSSGAKTALDLLAKPTKFLSTVQIGITLIGVLLGVYSGENLTHNITEILNGVEMLKPYSAELATGTIVVLITYLSIVLGELLPKRIGMNFPEPIIILLAKPMRVLSIITSPFVWLLTISINILLKVLGVKNPAEQAVSEAEIKSIIKESTLGGEVQEIEGSIVNKVFELGDRKVLSLMTHRSDIVFFTLNETLSQIGAKINVDKHSAYPVCATNNLDDIIGIVLLKDLFPAMLRPDFQISDYIIEPLYFNENTYAYKVLEVFKRESIHCGIVTDEYGTIQGIVSMNDVTDALIGASDESSLGEYGIVKRDHNSWYVDGQYSIIEFEKYFNLTISEKSVHGFTTVAGLIISRTNEIPTIGARIKVDDFVIEVIDKDGQRIDKVLVFKEY
jgi:putative hemolysin